MDSRQNCDWCKIAYGLENPKKEILFSTKHFLSLWQDAEKKEALILYKRHEAFPKHPDYTPYPPLPEDFESDLEKARDKAREILNSGASCYHRWPTSALYYHFQEMVSKEKISGAILFNKPSPE